MMRHCQASSRPRRVERQGITLDHDYFGAFAQSEVTKFVMPGLRPSTSWLRVENVDARDEARTKPGHDVEKVTGTARSAWRRRRSSAAATPAITPSAISPHMTPKVLALR